MSENPYASSATPLTQGSKHPPEIVLASRFKRLVARIVDALIEGLVFWICGFLIPGMRDTRTETMENAIPILENSELEPWLAFILPIFSIESLAFWVLTIMITFVCQAYLLARYGQTIGKRMLKIMIVNEHGYRKPTLNRSFFVRECGIYLLEWVPFLPFLDLLWIFGESRKCLHDHWSRTIVIDTINSTD